MSTRRRGFSAAPGQQHLDMPIEFPATRWSLIARLPGQPQQASVLLGLYADAVGAYLQLRLAGERPERIADIVQEVLLELLGRPEALARAQPGPGSRFRHWLMHLAWNSARNHLRADRRRDGAALDPEAPAPDQQVAMDRAWALSVVQQAMDDLQRAVAAGSVEPAALAVLSANLIEGRSMREIAAASGLSLATVSRRLAAARQYLQGAIAERLRLAGELADGEDAAVAGARLLEALA
jgi:RNA polymerase sigma factor (sigma-70 family)